jgi:periplasmic copper chaperone A
VQVCGDRQEAWTDVAKEGSDPHSLKSPAPTLVVAAPDAAGQGGHDHSAMHMDAGMGMPDAKDSGAGTYTAGDITVTAAYARAMLPGQPVGGGYLTVTNKGAENDRLVSATSPLAGMVEIHEMAMQGETMRMRKLNDGVDVPAGKTVELKPGGFHLMFMKVKAPFKAGDSVMLTLVFEKAGPVEVLLPVKAAGPGGAQHN